MKKILKLMLTASVIAAMQFIAACGDDSKDGNSPPSETEVAVQIRLAVDDMTATRSIDENAIADVNIYLYSSKKTITFIMLKMHRHLSCRCFRENTPFV